MISHSCPGSWTWDFLFYFKNIYIVNVIYINPRSYVSSVLSVGYTHVVNIPKETQNIFITLENFLISSQSIPQSFHSFLKTKKKQSTILLISIIMIIQSILQHHVGGIIQYLAFFTQSLQTSCCCASVVCSFIFLEVFHYLKMPQFVYLVSCCWIFEFFSFLD